MHLFILRLSITRSQTVKFKTQLTIAFFTAVNHYYNDNQWTLIKERNKMDQNLPITVHGCDLLNPVEVNLC